jgi:uncharacterized protein (TIGR00369 family)
METQNSAPAFEGKTGLAFLRAMLAEEIPAGPLHTVLGFRLVEASEGFAKFVARPGECHYNPIGNVHGGYTSALLDSALGCCVISTLDSASTFATLDLTVRLVRPMFDTTGEVAAEARILHRGRQVVTAEAKVLDGSGRLMAHATTTCMVLPRSSRKPGSISEPGAA